MSENEAQYEEIKEPIEEQQCVDKAGRVYTRKVVKINKFWEENNESTPPLIQKYKMVYNGKVRKIEEEDKHTENDSTYITIHQCPSCYLQFPELDHYKKHTCNPIKTKNKFKCIHCSKVYNTFDSLSSHMQTHLNFDKRSGEMKRVVIMEPYKCEVCNTIFPSYRSLRLHSRMHEPVKDKAVEPPVNYTISGASDKKPEKELVRRMFVCNICNNTYDKEYEEVHMKSHSEIENYICPICNRKFYTKENLEMHSKAHKQTSKYACEYCKKAFTTYEGLEEHVVNQCQNRQYECQYCGRRFSRPHEKVKHERIHTGEKPHVCQICGKSFRISYCLTLHLRTHSGTRPYKCNYCGKRFKSHSVYNHHMLTHSNVRRYKCPYCPKAFKTSVQLAGHKNSHTKPFTCNECNRPFASLYAVRAHMESHKRENNLKYDCWHCGATYARAYALRDHMKTHYEGHVENKELTEMETIQSTTKIENQMELEDEQQQNVQKLVTTS